jgi:hypothetical protein
MYTTWQHDFEQLEAFGKSASGGSATDEHRSDDSIWKNMQLKRTMQDEEPCARPLQVDRNIAILGARGIAREVLWRDRADFADQEADREVVGDGQGGSVMDSNAGQEGGQCHDIV